MDLGMDEKIEQGKQKLDFLEQEGDVPGKAETETKEMNYKCIPQKINETRIKWGVDIAKMEENRLPKSTISYEPRSRRLDGRLRKVPFPRKPEQADA
jgi:hypothetical protein